MVDERRCPHCSGPVTIDGQPYGQKYISCPYCAGESRIHEGQLIPVSEEEALRLEEQQRHEEPVYHYSAEQEAAMVRRDYLRRELGPVRLKCALLSLKVMKVGAYGLANWQDSEH